MSRLERIFMKGIYLAACKARHPKWDIVYQDIDKKFDCDIGGDMLDVDLSLYDFIIATPPCNWYSKSNPYYFESEYALKTMPLLPLILLKLIKLGKPFIVENVRNDVKIAAIGIFKLCEKYNVYVKYVGRHTYFTNIFCDLTVIQHQDFINGGKRINNDGYNQGGSNVHEVIEAWLTVIH